MILKNLTRKTGGSGKLLKYIFRYIFKEEKVLVPKEDRVYKAPQTREYPKDIWRERPWNAPDVKFTKDDLLYLRWERENWGSYKDIKAKGLLDDPKTYFDRYVKPTLPKPQPEAFIITHNVNSKTFEGMQREFEENEKNRKFKRKDQPQVHHAILSWSNKDRDKITTVMLQDMAREFIHLRGEDILYAGTVHTDKSHLHLHIAYSATRLHTGLSSSIRWNDFEKLKNDLQEYQRSKYPQLIHSLPEHGRARRARLQHYGKDIKIDERFDERTRNLRGRRNYSKEKEQIGEIENLRSGGTFSMRELLSDRSKWLDEMSETRSREEGSKEDFERELDKEETKHVDNNEPSKQDEDERETESDDDSDENDS